MAEKSEATTGAKGAVGSQDDSDALAKKTFVITCAGSALFIGTVFIFVLL